MFAPCLDMRLVTLQSVPGVESTGSDDQLVFNWLGGRGTFSPKDRESQSLCFYLAPT